MDPNETPSTQDRKRIAHERLAARARRIRTLRRRVVAGSLATFVLAWGVVSQTGALGQSAATTAASTSAATTTMVSVSDDSSTSASTSDTTSSVSTPVTTSQS
jgi:hypothetical protein